MATTTTTKTQAKKPATSLPKTVFGVNVANHELLKLAYDAYLANGRVNHARTKTRGEVSGGGRKPWRQKGTGRARFGSTRNPIWRHGGIAFGPTGNENYKINISQKQKQVALRQALTLANADKKIKVIDDVKATGKTKQIIELLKANDAEKKRRVLLVTAEKSPELLRATNNIENLIVSKSNYLTVYHILNADVILLSASSVKEVEAWLGGKK